MSNYKEKAEKVFGFVGTLSKENPGIAEGFVALHKAGGSDGVISAKNKELIALGIAIAIRCEGCIACHVMDAIKAGANKEEIVETIGVAVLMGGGPSVVYGQKAYEAIDEFVK